MAKFVIEDMIPPEKKHRRAHGAHTKKSSSEGRSVALEREEQSSVVPKKTISEAFPEDPRGMIANQVAEEAEKAPTATLPDGSLALGATTEEINTLGGDTWSRDLSLDKAAVDRKNIPPQFPEYRSSPVEYDDGRGGMRTWLPWVFGVALLVAAGFFLLDFFAGATVTILPKRELIPLEQQFTAFKTAAEGKLSYAVMVETASSSSEVPATGEKTVTAKASGRIIVYNEQLTAQRLIKNTRFQAPGGKIYRINDSITIPKGVLQQNKAVKPGSLEVTVYADEAGPSYNSPPVDFTVPGLKNSTIYEKVYARSKGPLAGGASGTVKTVSDQDLKKAGEDLRIQLETKLRAKARSNLGGSQIAYDKGLIVTLGEPKLSSAPSSSVDKATVSAEGTIAVVTFQRALLARLIVKTLVPDVPESAGTRIAIKNLDALEFAMSTEKSETLVEETKLQFTIKGTPELSWEIDEEAVKTALLGLPKERFNEMLSQQPSVERANAAIRPLWKRSFPTDPSKISVILVESMPEN